MGVYVAFYNHFVEIIGNLCRLFVVRVVFLTEICYICMKV